MVIYGNIYMVIYYIYGIGNRYRECADSDPALGARGELHVGCNFKTMATDTILCQ